MQTNKNLDDYKDAARGHNIQTYSGGPFFIEDPRPVDVSITDIAHALSNLCRFNGHCTRFYSVADHSLRVLTRVAVETDDRIVRLQALLHDAAEAYVGDMPSPIKGALPEFGELERRVWHAIATRFGVPVDLDPRVKHADLVLLATERRDLMVEAPDVKWGDLPVPEGLPIVPMTPHHARECFLHMFRTLTKETN